MAIDTTGLIVHCQMALQLTQAQLGDLIGVHKRTIQRWQDKPWTLTVHQSERLAAALRPVRPDLAEQVLEIGRHHAQVVGVAPPVLPATPGDIQQIVRVAMDAGGLASLETGRAVVAAVFGKAEQLGLEVGQVLDGLD